MRYFLLRNSVDPMEIGDFPQVISFSKPYNAHRLHNTLNEGELSDDFSLPDYFIFNKKAKFCDYLSSNYFGYRSIIISPELYDLISKYKIDVHEKISCKVKMDRKFIGFIFVRFPFARNGFIKWSMSEWYLIEDDPENFGRFLERGVAKPADYEDLLEMYKENRIKKKIIPFKAAVESLDIFYIDNIAFKGLVISERVKENLGRNKITGIRSIELIDEEKVIRLGLNESSSI